MYRVLLVVLQATGLTPLFVASQNGHVECVRTLLDRGAAVNQADVGDCSSMARHCGVCVREAPQSLFVCTISRLGGLWCHVVEAFGRVVKGRCAHACCTGGYEEGV